MKIRSPRYAREIPQRYRYEAARTTSGKIFYPPRVVYPGGEKATPYTLVQTGKVLTWTTLQNGPAEYTDSAPYVMAIVELDDGARITAMMGDVENTGVKTGMRVRIEFRKIRQEGHEGLLCYGYKVVPE
jgi:uncharacterized OB-fold protein